MDYQVSNKAKMWTTIFMVVGIVFTGIGVIAAMGDGNLGQKFMGNVLSNSFFFFSIAISAMFFLALQYATESGWFVYIKRVIEAITGFLPVGMGLLLITFITLSFMNGAHIYMWMDPEVMKERSEEHTSELQSRPH